MNKIAENIELLVSYAESYLDLDPNDLNFARNNLLDLFKLSMPCENKLIFDDEIHDIECIIDDLVQYGMENNLANSDDPMLFETKVFGLVTPVPSQVIDNFSIIQSVDGIEEATSWFFEFSKANNYIRMRDINKNIMWHHTGSKGDIVVTINLSKPEKDPKQIQAALQAKTGYPKCMLCPTNVGFVGNAAHPARQTLRTIPIVLTNEIWHIQFSPYQYYDEHIIAFCDDHRPMVVNKNCITRLVEFVNQFPHYFMGSNAALPIVGGSILTHDHYQGGGKNLPMFATTIRKNYISPYKNINVSVLEWYNSVIRVSGKDMQSVIDAANDIMTKWANYSDESVNITCHTDLQHNAVTPIARVENDEYVVDMILRNNRTDEVHPYGIYHPTEDLHNIKKEGIGIIEVMGTFILPGRLDKELNDIKQILQGCGESLDNLNDANNHLYKHKHLIKELTDKFGVNNSIQDSERIVTDSINIICEKILDCTAVFKNTTVGQLAFDKFMTQTVKCK